MSMASIVRTSPTCWPRRARCSARCPITRRSSDLTPAARAQVRLMLAAMQDLVTSVSMEETLDGVQVEIAGMGGGTLKHLKMGFGGEAPDGMLHAWLDIGLDGLESPSLPPKIAGYLPKHFEIKPSLSGVQTADLQKLAQDADWRKTAARTWLRPTSWRCFRMAAPMRTWRSCRSTSGRRRWRAPGTSPRRHPVSWHGDAHVTATGFDDLMKQAHDDPDLAAGAAGPDHAARDGEAGWRSAGVGHRERRPEADGERHGHVGADGGGGQAQGEAASHEAGSEAWSAAKP